MDKSFTALKDIAKIEEELTSNYAGVLALNIGEERLIQVPCTFLYYHKNVFAALQEEDDLLEKVVFETEANFTVLRSEKIKHRKDQNQKASYKIVSVSLNGILKRPEDSKITDEIKDLFALKYTGIERKEEDLIPVRFVMLDTLEIKALEEVGG
jgi:hypothetical protein